MNKTDLLKKLKALANDERGNINERKLAEERLNELLIKYNIDPEDINTENLVRRDFYFREDWERKLLGQTLYMLFPEKDFWKNTKKRNWIWCEMTDAEYLEFETHYCAYKASYQHEQELFFTAFISKNKIFPPDEKVPENKRAPESKMSRGDRLRAAMMMDGIQSTTVRRLLNE